jgi:hypothetical protein
MAFEPTARNGVTQERVSTPSINTALRESTAEARALQFQLIHQDVEEWGVRRGGYVPLLPIDTNGRHNLTGYQEADAEVYFTMWTIV